MPVIINLNDEEVAASTVVGLLRASRDTDTSAPGWADRLAGAVRQAGAEYAVGKFLGQFPDFLEYKERRAIVRGRKPLPNGKLPHVPVYEADADSALIIGVSGEGSRFRIMGYVGAKAAKQRAWWMLFPHAQPAFHVPPECLNTMEGDE